MNLKNIFFSLITFLSISTISYGQVNESVIKPLEDERWWGGIVALGSKMPYGMNLREYDLSRDNLNNQVVPLFLSSKGRYVWSEDPFTFSIKDGDLIICSDYEKVEVTVAGTTLRDAYIAAKDSHFPPSGGIPEPIFFSKPQYNTWIELMYNQNQEDILTYADNVLEYGFPNGVFMVDDNWQKYYGNFEFKPDRFPNPKEMTDKLHRMGFKVMLWISPFVSADSPEYRTLSSMGYLLKDKATGSNAMITWWNGVSACYDTTNPKAMEYLKAQLKRTQADYGIDGFKLDAGDVSYMQGDYKFFEDGANINIFSQRWAELGLEFPYNELRTSWKLGGLPIVQRLGDKNYSWNACSLIIPDMISAGLLGHLYTCPDMIGGGQFGSFLNVDESKFDMELIVRSCQLHAMMPMMQFSVAPWRILDDKHIEICAKFAKLHESMGDYILYEAKKSSISGEPIVRHMEYSFPNQGFIGCKDQFMLGDDYLVAPMIKPGGTRTVSLPKGEWIDDLGEHLVGPIIFDIDVPLDRLPYYKRK